jgi:hypothetical protein
LKYKHFKGKIYEVICEGVLESNPNMVLTVYKSQENGRIWIRPSKEFYGYKYSDGERI